MGRVELMGMAKPMPSTPSAATLALLMPTTCPSALTRAPPELPGLMAAFGLDELEFAVAELDGPGRRIRRAGLLTQAISILSQEYR